MRGRPAVETGHSRHFPHPGMSGPAPEGDLPRNDAQCAGSRPHPVPVLQEARKNANIHDNFGVIWGIPIETGGGAKCQRSYCLLPQWRSPFLFHLHSHKKQQKPRESCDAFCTKRCSTAQAKSFCMGRCVPSCNMTRASKK